MSQLVAAMSSVGGPSANNSHIPTSSLNTPSTSSSNSIYSIYNRTRRDKTPEPPPAPRLSECVDENKTKMKSIQGALPMDLENDVEIDLTDSTQPNTPGKPEQQLSKTSDPTMLFNGPISGGVNAAATGYMFFPTNAGSMIMDPSAMMGAAMQQMQGFSAFLPGTSDATTIDATIEDLTEQAGRSLFSFLFKKDYG